MRRFNDACKLASWNECHIASALAAHNHNLLLIDDLIQNAGQIFAQVGVRCIRGHENLMFIVQDSCTA